MIASQYPYKLNPVIREMATAAFIFRQSTDRSLTCLSESFGSWFSDKAEFGRFLLESTGEHQFVWVDVGSTSDKKEDVYRVCRAPAQVPAFKLKFAAN